MTINQPSNAPTESGPESSNDRVKSTIRLLTTLVKNLPPTVPLATEEDRICQVFRSVQVPDFSTEGLWETFNRRMDLLFGEDQRCPDSGHLKNILRGPHGMDMVMGYMDTAARAGYLILEAVEPKFARLASELTKINSMDRQPVRARSVSMEVIDDEDKLEIRRCAASKRKALVINLDDDGDEANDADYNPPKRNRKEPQQPARVYDEDGEEILSDTEHGIEVREKKQKKTTKKAGVGASAQKAKTKEKGKQTSKAALTRSSGRERSDIDSGSESDGGSARRKVDEAEAMEASKNARRGPANESMQHYSTPKAITDAKGNPRWEFKCKYCQCIRSVPRAVVKKGAAFDDEPNLPKLNNLATHTKGCKKKPDPNQAQPEGHEDEPATAEQINLKKSAELMRHYLKDGELNTSVPTTTRGFLRLFAAWILDEDLPWTTGEAPTLALLFKYLKVRFELPSDTTVRNQLAKIFAELHAKVVRAFTDVKSKIAYAEDTWTTKQMVYTFACTIGSFINEDWELIEMVVDFKPLDEKEHQGLYAGKAFVDGAKDRGGLNKMSFAVCFAPIDIFVLPGSYLYFISLTTDNASVNDVLVKTVSRCLLARYGIEWNPDSHMRCLAHVENLTVQDILAYLDEGEWSDTCDYFELNKDQPIHYSLEEDDEQQALEQEEESSEDVVDMDEDFSDSADEMAGQSPLKRLRYITGKIVSSPQRRQRYRKIARQKYPASGDHRANLMPMRDVRTRWNYSHAMVRRGELVREAIDTWTFETKETRGLVLSDRDWKLLGKLADVLEPFTQVTKLISQAKTPTIPFMLPSYHLLEQHLITVSEGTSSDIPPTIRLAAAAGLTKLRKYKVQADMNHYAILGTVLHPGMRSLWFENTGSTSSEREDARRKVEELLRHVALSYFREHIEEPSQTPGGSTSAHTPEPARQDWGILQSMCAVTLPQPQPETPKQRTEAELEVEITSYLKFVMPASEEHLNNPLSWWKAHEKLYPTLARMARDFLAIPATSVSVERTFSKSRHICSDLRSSLKAETIRQSLLAKTWIRSGLLDVNEPQRPRKRHGAVDNVTSV